MIDEPETKLLSDRDRDIVLEALENPALPNEELKKLAVEHYKSKDI